MGRKTMVYESCRSWNNGDLHIISKTALLPRQYDPYNGIFLFARLVRVIRVVKQWFTSRTVGELHIIKRDLGCIDKSTTRATRTGRETKVYESYSW